MIKKEKQSKSPIQKINSAFCLNSTCPHPVQDISSIHYNEAYSRTTRRPVKPLARARLRIAMNKLQYLRILPNPLGTIYYSLHIYNTSNSYTSQETS